jgi:hypothetical protein
MPMRRPSFVLPLFILAGLILVSAALRARERLTISALTTEEAISLAKLQSADAKEPPLKFEWTLPGKRYVRYLVQERDSAAMAWHTRDGFAYNVPLESALFIFEIGDRHSKMGAENVWTLETRLGGSTTYLGMPLSGWAGSTHFLPVATEEFTAKTQVDDPGNLYVLTTGAKQYRIRLESSETPFPGKQPLGNDKS